MTACAVSNKDLSEGKTINRAMEVRVLRQSVKRHPSLIGGGMGRGRRPGQFRSGRQCNTVKQFRHGTEENSIQAPIPTNWSPTATTNKQRGSVSRRCCVGTSTSTVGDHGSRYLCPRIKVKITDLELELKRKRCRFGVT